MSAKTTKQQEALTELLDLLTQNGKKQEAAELSALFAQFSAMETQYGKVLSELSAVREQLATLHDGGNRTAAMQETKQTQAHIPQAKATLSHLQEAMTDRIRKTLADAGDSGDPADGPGNSRTHIELLWHSASTCHALSYSGFLYGGCG